MDETTVQSFWNSHPCGDHIVGGLHGAFGDDYEKFFTAYDELRGRFVEELGQASTHEAVIAR